MKILLLGSNGQLGQSILHRAAPNFLTPLTKEGLDISDRSDVFLKVNQETPDIVINAAAYTDVNLAEIHQDKAKKINTNGPRYLVEACSKNDIPIIHISTDYVFDGNKKSPYLPSDKTGPIGIYGKTKLDGEMYVQEYKFGYVIRTSWLFSEYGKNFFKTMYALSKKQTEISVVCDEIGCPTYAGDLADCLILSSKYILANKLIPGIYHYASSNHCSWYDFAKSIFKEGYAQKKIKKIPSIQPISGKLYHKNCNIRPKYSALDSSLLSKQIGIDLPDWRSSIQKLF